MSGSLRDARGSPRRDGGSEAWAPGYPPRRCASDLHGLGGLGEKALMKRKVLQPLAGWPAQAPVLPAPAAPGPAAAGPAAPAAAVGGAAEAWRAPAAEAARPRTAGSRNRPPLGGEVAFPAQLRLRASSEAPGAPGPWSAPGDVLVVPLDTQHEIRRLASACGEGRPVITDGALLTAWAVLPAGGPGPHLLEPLAARRVDQSLAVEPIELAFERQAAGASTDDPDAPLRYGEGFRLRAAGCEGLYLGHGAPGGLRWVVADMAPARASAGAQAPAAPSGTRFSAHGGELGAPVLMGRPLSLQRVASPAPPCEDSDAESQSSSDASDAHSDADSDAEALAAERRRRRASRRRGGGGRGGAAAGDPGGSPPPGAAPAPASALLPEADDYVAAGLFSRAADIHTGVFPATLLPLMEQTLLA